MARALAGGHTPIWKDLWLGVSALKRPRKVQGLDSTRFHFVSLNKWRLMATVRWCPSDSPSCNCPERVAFSGGGRVGMGPCRVGGSQLPRD